MEKKEGMERAIGMTRRHCLFTMISAAVVVVCVCIGVTMNLTTIYDENFDHMGLRTFCMFTVNSNILMGVSMSLVFPYTVPSPSETRRIMFLLFKRSSSRIFRLPSLST